MRRMKVAFSPSAPAVSVQPGSAHKSALDFMMGGKCITVSCRKAAAKWEADEHLPEERPVVEFGPGGKNEESKR